MRAHTSDGPCLVFLHNERGEERMHSLSIHHGRIHLARSLFSSRGASLHKQEETRRERA